MTPRRILLLYMRLPVSNKCVYNFFLYNYDFFLGLTAYLLTILSLIFGIVLIFAKLIFKTCNVKPVFLKTIHIFLGTAAYVLGIVALCSGLRNYFTEASYATNSGFISILIIGTILNIFGPLKTFFRF